MSPVIRTNVQMLITLQNIDLGGLWLKAEWNFRAVDDHENMGVKTGWLISLVESQTTREWFLPNNPTVNDVLRTCRKCLLGSMEHRVDEHFLFNGKRVYDPHREVV